MTPRDDVTAGDGVEAETGAVITVDTPAAGPPVVTASLLEDGKLPRVET